MTRETLIAFEKEIAELFNLGKIRAPVHLAGGNEEQLIEIFKSIHQDDWVCCAWRSHYHCLLKGVPATQLRGDILTGHSIALCYPEHKIISSAIAGGILPIALGLAWSIKRRKSDQIVWVFVGDMTSFMGMFHETTEYAFRHELPIQFVVENNGMSVYTPTEWAWGKEHISDIVQFYHYKLPWPHAGAGQRVEF